MDSLVIDYSPALHVGSVCVAHDAARLDPHAVPAWKRVIEHCECGGVCGCNGGGGGGFLPAITNISEAG